MPEEPETIFYPDDGSMELLDREAGESPNVAITELVPTAHYFGGWRGLAVYRDAPWEELRIMLQLRTWLDGESPPDWPLEDPAPGDTFLSYPAFPHTIELAEVWRTTAGSFNEDEEWIVTSSATFLQRRWRFTWAPIVAEPHAWHFTHLRFRDKTWLRTWTDGDPDFTGWAEPAYGDVQDWWRKGKTVSPTYNINAPSSWPKTDWVEGAMPTVTEPGPPSEGDPPNHARGGTRLQLVWPRRWFSDMHVADEDPSRIEPPWVKPTGLPLTTRGYAQGVVPGAAASSGPYEALWKDERWLIT